MILNNEYRYCHECKHWRDCFYGLNQDKIGRCSTEDGMPKWTPKDKPDSQHNSTGEGQPIRQKQRVSTDKVVSNG